MKILDEWDVLDDFNRACAEIANSLESYVRYAQIDEYTLEIPIIDINPTIDDWWAINFDGVTLFEKHTRDLSKNLGYKSELQKRLKLFEQFPELSKQLDEEIAGKANPEAYIMRYTPHNVGDYAMPLFFQYDGFKMLNKEVKDRSGLELAIAICPIVGAKDILEPGAYQLLAYVTSTDGEPVQSKFKKSAPRLS
jgi:hypothetical protein